MFDTKWTEVLKVKLSKSGQYNLPKFKTTTM